jgi:carbonic anhydrase/acetyltransferase-like protein (isoleucine patch superfamily)
MPIYALGNVEPVIAATAFIHPDAVIIGDVVIGDLSSVWPCAVLRGDDGIIRVGARTSIQDGSVLHTTPESPTLVGDECTIGHLVHLEGCTVERGALVGSGSVVLHRAVISTGSLVAANSVVLADTVIPPGALAVGSPVAIKPGRASAQLIAHSVEMYLQKNRRFTAELRRVG